MAKDLTVEQANDLLKKGEVKVFDLRDEGSYNAAHIDGAVRLTHENMAEFVANSEKEVPILVYCYHGISSEAAAEFLSEQGFSEVYSMIGGFEAWRSKYTANSD